MLDYDLAYPSRISFDVFKPLFKAKEPNTSYSSRHSFKPARPLGVVKRYDLLSFLTT